MTAATLPAISARRAGWRWGVSFGVVLVLHAVGVLWLRQVQPQTAAPPIPMDAVLMELAPAAPLAPPMPVSAPAVPAPPVPSPPPPQPPAPPPEAPAPMLQPSPPEPALPPPVPASPPPVTSAAPELVLPPPPPPPPRPAPPRRPPPPRHAPVRTVQPAPSAPNQAPEEARQASPPAAAAPSPAASPAPAASSTQAQASWESRLFAHLLSFRHYPPAAERRGIEGVTVLHIVLDPGGRVLSASMVRSSGHDDLDDEAMAWLHRAEPLPAPPPGSPLQLNVPFGFHLAR